MVSKPRSWTIRALCRGGRCRGTVLIGGTGRSRKLYAESGSCSARATRLGRASIPKRKRRSPASSQRSRCLVWVKSVSPPHQKRAEAGLAAEEDDPVDEAGGQFM